MPLYRSPYRAARVSYCTSAKCYQRLQSKCRRIPEIARPETCTDDKIKNTGNGYSGNRLPVKSLRGILDKSSLSSVQAPWQKVTTLAYMLRLANILTTCELF